MSTSWWNDEYDNSWERVKEALKRQLYWLSVLCLCFASEILFIFPVLQGFDFDSFCEAQCKTWLWRSDCVACFMSLGLVVCMVGALLDVGSGKMKPREVEEILKSRIRTERVVSAPAKGLSLEKVFYRKPWFV